MWKRLFGEWRSKDLLQAALDETAQMLDHAREMIMGTTREILFGAPLRFDPAAKDAELNRLQVAIRRKLIRYMHTHPRQDIVACVTLMHVVVYIERLGDYAKNIHELAVVLAGAPFNDLAHADELRTLTGRVEQLLDHSRGALVSESTEDARRVLEMHQEISARAQAIIDALVREDDGGAAGRRPTAAALYARYLKRISGHLMNAASTVINAFDQIGFYPDKGGAGDDE